jgi:light-regulated signal transduction histidine kinase (bacteriophytochrome)
MGGATIQPRRAGRGVTLTVDDPFHAVFAANPLPMWLYDSETSAVIDVNDAALAQFGIPREEFLKRAATELRADSAAHAVGMSALRVEFQAVSQPLDVYGRPAILVTLHDVTAQRAAERALADAQHEQRRLTVDLEERVRQRTVQLQAAISELEAFSYSVSHDLRAPLRSIAGFSQALIEDAGPLLPPEARDDVNRIVAAARRMDHLINDLLTLSMVTRSDMTREAIDMSDLAHKIVAELADVSPGRTVTTTIAPNMVAHGDPRLVRVVLENLLTNAWKFTSRREHASIEIGQRSGDSGGHVFFVRDNGVGFDPAYADKLFGPFQRLHDATQFPGTGIGLATVRRIVLRHGGRVWAEGRTAEGASFYFTLQ